MTQTATRFYECDMQAQSCTVADLTPSIKAGKSRLASLRRTLRNVIFSIL